MPLPLCDLHDTLAANLGEGTDLRVHFLYRPGSKGSTVVAAVRLEYPCGCAHLVATPTGDDELYVKRLGLPCARHPRWKLGLLSRVVAKLRRGTPPLLPQAILVPRP